MQNPFKSATRKVYAHRGQKTLPELADINPMIDIKAAYQDRLTAISERRRARDEERGRSVTVPGTARAADRDRQRRSASQVRKGQRAYDRKIGRQKQNEVTAANMARALAGDFGPVMQRNVQVVADREAANMDALRAAGVDFSMYSPGEIHYRTNA